MRPRYNIDDPLFYHRLKKLSSFPAVSKQKPKKTTPGDNSLWGREKVEKWILQLFAAVFLKFELG